MFRKKSFTMALATLLGAAVAALSAQAPQGGGGRGGRGGPAAGQTVEKIRQLKPNLYMITGGGANTLVRVTGEGLIVVDTKNPGDENFNRVMEEIRSVSALPVKYVLNTHHHPDHVGTNQKFVDAGAQVIGLDALKTRMASDPRTKDIPGLPTVTFAKDYVLKFGGAEVQAHSFGRGHTGDDTMVYFPDLKVVMVSDQITAATPIVDFANGGSARRVAADPRRRAETGFRHGDSRTGRAEEPGRDRGVPNGVCQRDQSCIRRDQGGRLEGSARVPGEDRRPRLAVQRGVLRPVVRRDHQKVVAGYPSERIRPPSTMNAPPM